ncbi:MAG: hypothetical protein JW864_10915 [Spirochaetes bacterium]|nr:hypothetical protein [Spirochaetota bacterium]
MELDYYPENNLIVLLLLFLLTAGLYLFWWIARVSRIFDDNPVSNIFLIIFTGGIWYVYLSLKYMHKSEQLNNRDLKWYMFFFVPISFLIIQNNINERYFPGK